MKTKTKFLKKEGIRMEIYNLEHLWDHEKVLRNPHKGWYLHYFDNGLDRYGSSLDEDDYLLDFPGLNHIYLRLAWSYLEPEEGNFQWHIIDDVIKRWREKGYTVAFRITCKEVRIEIDGVEVKQQVFATPEWVKNAGAKGRFIGFKGSNERIVWEPDYGDPIFLEKLNNFHKAFSEKFDDKQWVEYIDIGSFGDWGEGHTSASSRMDWPVEVIKKHIDIYCNNYKNSILMFSDGLIGSRTTEDGSREELLNYFIEKGTTLRDDSPCVKHFADRYGFSTLRNPEMFDLFWRRKPVDLELQHYPATLKDETWKEGKPFTTAVREAHPSFIGFHGYAREFLKDNPVVAKELANLSGYWYFLKSIEMPVILLRESNILLKMVWENHGVAPAYNKYNLYIKFENTRLNVNRIIELKESNNKNWMPGWVTGESNNIKTQKDQPSGEYTISVSLIHESEDTKRNIELGFMDDIRTDDGFYKILKVQII